MKRFFIFLDIDGVMYDWDYIVKEVDSGKTELRDLKHYKPESVQALNYLMEELRKDHRVKLVISSTMRRQLADITRILYNNGVKLKGAVDATLVSNHQEFRALEIISYLETRTFDNEDYGLVVIDDEYFDFKKYFTQDQIIKTEMFHSALSMDMVKNFLKSYRAKQIQEIQIENN